MLVNNYLMITGVVETDAGEYTCAARDKNGCFAKVSAYLRVNIVGHDKSNATHTKVLNMLTTKVTSFMLQF